MTSRDDWREVAEFVPGDQTIASQGYDIAAGVSMVAGGLIPTVAFTFYGPLTSEVGDPAAKVYKMTALLQTPDVEKFARQAVEASKARPS